MRIVPTQGISPSVIMIGPCALVGIARFELAAFASQVRHSAKLSYIPILAVSRHMQRLDVTRILHLHWQIGMVGEAGVEPADY